MSGNVLCIGDIILDSYSHGDVKRISPEAPIPVLKINNNKYEVLGGCGNVAKNICGAGSKCHIISVCGDDEESIVLKKLLKDSKKLTFNLLTDQSRCTTKKIRFVSGNQQILRVDKQIYKYFDLKIVANHYNVNLSKVPISIKIVLENLCHFRKILSSL